MPKLDWTFEGGNEGWRQSSDGKATDGLLITPATATDMMQVLGQPGSFRLSGDIRYGDEYTRIEDVSITPTFFTSGTFIATPAGERAVETLRPGDLVMTRDYGSQELRWVGMRAMKAANFAAKPRIRPIRIRAGALGT